MMNVVTYAGIWRHVLPFRSAGHIWQLRYPCRILHVAPLWDHWYQCVQAQGDYYGSTHPCKYEQATPRMYAYFASLSDTCHRLCNACEFGLCGTYKKKDPTGWVETTETTRVGLEVVKLHVSSRSCSQMLLC